TSGQETIKSCAGPQIEDSLSSFQRGDGQRITTAQAKVRGFRRERRIFGGVTKGIAAGGSAAIVATRRFPARSGAITLSHFLANRVRRRLGQFCFHKENEDRTRSRRNLRC